MWYIFEKSLIVDNNALFRGALTSNHSTWPLVISISICQVESNVGKIVVDAEHPDGLYLLFPQLVPAKEKGSYYREEWRNMSTSYSEQSKRND